MILNKEGLKLVLTYLWERTKETLLTTFRESRVQKQFLTYGGSCKVSVLIIVLNKERPEQLLKNILFVKSF